MEPGAIAAFAWDPPSIPEGASGTTYAIKLFAWWTPGSLPLQFRTGETVTCWTALGTDLSDQTLTTMALVTSAGKNFGNVQVYARYSNPRVCVGILGDSILSGLADRPDPTTGAVTLGKAFRSVVPHVNISRSCDSMGAYRRSGGYRKVEC